MLKGAGLIALATLALAVMSPGTAQPGGKPMDTPQLVGSTWLAEDIRGGGVIDTAQSTITIAADGAVSGSGGCNRLMGRAKVSDGELRFGPLATTRMACVPSLMDQERKFLAALEAARTYRLDGAVLRFYDAAGTELVRFARKG